MRRAADACDSDALYFRGYDFDKAYHGEGYDKEKAVSYFRRSAQLGFSDSQFEFGFHLYSDRDLSAA